MLQKRFLLVGAALLFSVSVFAAKTKSKVKTLSDFEKQFIALALEGDAFRKSCDNYFGELEQIAGPGGFVYHGVADHKRVVEILDKLEKLPVASKALQGGSQLFLDHEAEVLKWRDSDLILNVSNVACHPTEVFTISGAMIESSRKIALSGDDEERLKVFIISLIRTNLGYPAAAIQSGLSIREIEKLDEADIIHLKKAQKLQLGDIKDELTTLRKKLDKEFDLVIADETKGTAQKAKELREVNPIQVRIRDFATAL